MLRGGLSSLYKNNEFFLNGTSAIRPSRGKRLTKASLPKMATPEKEPVAFARNCFAAQTHKLFERIEQRIEETVFLSYPPLPHNKCSTIPHLF